MKDYDKNKELPCLKYQGVNNSYGWEITQKFPVDDFKQVEGISEFNEDSLKSILMKVMKNIFLNCMNILKMCITFAMIYPFRLKE